MGGRRHTMVPNPGCRLALVQCASWTRRCALGAPARLGAHSALHPHLSRDRAAAAARARSAERTRRTLCGRKPRQPDLTHTHPRTHALKQASRPASSHASVSPSPVVVRASAPPAAPRLSAPTDRIAASSSFLFSSWFLSIFFILFFFLSDPPKKKKKNNSPWRAVSSLECG